MPSEQGFEKMMKKVSDYVFQKLREAGVSVVFTLTGGGIMHLVDSMGESGMDYVCCHHEQACAIAAQAYGMYHDQLGVCLVTTGPGGTNALTGTAAAYMDSTPMLFLSGQVKREDFASLRGVRQFGAQENDIVSMARPVTKYAVTVMRGSDIRYELEKAISLATTGRKGPVWVDIPLDVQAELVDEHTLRGYVPPQEAEDDGEIQRGADAFAAALEKAERPLILIGHGAAVSHSGDLIRALIQERRIPVLSTWRARGVFSDGDPLFFGSPGLQAPRYSNLILQTCDLLLVLGSRLDNMITAFCEEHFAFRAQKIIVDIDEREMNKLRMPQLTRVRADCRRFLEVLVQKLSHMPAGQRSFSDWAARCASCRAQFPLERERQRVTAGVDLYRVTLALSDACGKDDTIVVSSTSRCNTAGHMAFRHQAGQRVLSSMGLGSMGFALPSAVGAWFAARRGRLIVLEGDGSLQLNIQELQTIAHYRIPAKLFIFNNRGYAAISAMQERNFDGRYVGCNKQSGVTMPDLSKIADAYGLPCFRIERGEEIESVVRAVMETDGAAVCDIAGDPGFDEIPKCISSVNEHGRRVSAALENPYPCLSSEELERVCGALLTNANKLIKGCGSCGVI